MTQRQTRCIDCNAVGRQTGRPALNPGPRCVEHHRERKRAISKALHDKRIEQNFEIDGDTYWAIYDAQGGVCYGCGKAKGIRRRLAVDHDHNCDAGHPPEQGCRKCIRALLCAYCNEIVGRLNADALARLIVVLTDPPAQRILRAIMAIDEGFEP